MQLTGYYGRVANRSDIATGKVPHVLVVFHVEYASPFLDYVLEAFAEQDYPKSMMTVRFIVSDSPAATRCISLLEIGVQPRM